MPAIDLFQQLQAMSWRGIVFPTTGFEMLVEQDQHEHRFAERDGAHVEATGRAPLVFTATALFRNGVGQGGADKFPDPLYPTTFRKFLKAATNRTTGDFVHPELGKFPAKLRSARIKWTATVRDGVDVECTWVESTDKGAELDAAIAANSPAALAASSAATLDTNFASTTQNQALLAELFPDDVDKKISFTELVDRTRAAGDQVAVLRYRAEGAINAALYRTGLVIDSLQGQPALWDTRRAAEELYASLYQTSRAIGTPATASNIKVYRVTKPQTLGAIAQRLGLPVATLVALNPRAGRAPTVAAGTEIRYAA